MIIRIIDSILPVITHIINFSLSSGTFPSTWRKAYVLPLPKITNPVAPYHFRPISILPFLSKILEAVVHKQISAYIHKNNLLSSFQSGFRPGHSTTTALLKIVGDVKTAMENSQLTVLVLIDFTNAFNLIDHDILLVILNLLGFSSSAQDWFLSYLRDRQQAVYVNGDISSWRTLNAGVPQGGILSPIMFSIFINLLTFNLQCSYHLYADDLQLYAHADNISLNETVADINKALKNISEWSRNFGITINPSKCQAIILGSSRRIAQIDWDNITPIVLNNITIDYQSQVKDLGLFLDSSLTWSAQVNAVCGKATSILRNLYRHKNSLPIQTKILLVQTLVFPIIDYADVCYSDINQNLLVKLDRILNNCIRFIFGLRKYDHISLYRTKLKWLPVQHRRNLRTLTTLFSILNDPFSPSYLKHFFNFLSDIHDRELRSSSNLTLLVPSNRTEFLANFFATKAVRLWNALPTDIKEAPTRNSFKLQVRRHFLQNP